MSARTPVTQTSFVGAGTRPSGSVGPWLASLGAILAEAREPAAPLLRRLRLLGAFGRRLDALYQLHAAPLRAQTVAGRQQRAAVRTLHGQALRLLHEAVLPALARRGPGLVRWSTLGPEDRATLTQIFASDISPLLTPLTVDAAHPFPGVASLALNLGVLVRQSRGTMGRYVGIEVPPALPRFVVAPRSGAVLCIEEVIAANLPILLPDRERECSHVFRVTRDGRPLRARESRHARTRAPVRLEVDEAAPPALRRLLTRALGLADEDVDPVPGPLDLSSLVRLPLGSGGLRSASAPTSRPARAARGGSLR